MVKGYLSAGAGARMVGERGRERCQTRCCEVGPLRRGGCGGWLCRTDTRRDAHTAGTGGRPADDGGLGTPQMAYGCVVSRWRFLWAARIARGSADRWLRLWRSRVGSGGVV